MRYSGLKYILDSLNFNINGVKAAFDFQEYQPPTTIVLPNFWATGSATGRLNNIGQFFNTSGSGFFNGSTKMELDKNLNLGDTSTLLFSYKKLRPGNEILISSITGNSFENYSGFCVGVNDANKLYFKYWNPIEGPFTFTYENILADKNLIVINKIGPIVSMGRFNNNTFTFEVENFQIKNNVFRESNKIYLGGHNINHVGWASGNNFSGFIDEFYLIDNIPVFYNNLLASGIFSNIQLSPQIQTSCFQTGVWINSGYQYLAPTGTALQPVVTVQQQITGYQNILTGTSYSGVTGYQKIILGTGIDNCGIQKELYYEIPLSGLITNQYTVQSPLFGNVNVTGYNQIELSGLVTGITGYWLLQEQCVQLTGDLQENAVLNYDYLSELSFSEISLLENFDKDKNDYLEVFTEPYVPQELLYNKDIIFNRLNLNFNTLLDVNDFILFANGQALINGGYDITQSGYDTFIIPKVDYIVTGDLVETNRYFGDNDFLFYDSYDGNTEWYKISGNNTISIPTFSNYWTFRNGQKLTGSLALNSFTIDNFVFQNTINGGVVSSSLNKDGSILVVGDSNFGLSTGIVSIYSRDFINNNWNLQQSITGTFTNQRLGFKVKINKEAILITSFSHQTPIPSFVDIFTGNINNGWKHKQTFSGIPGYTLGRSAININENNTVIALSAESTETINPNNLFFARTGFVQILTGNINNGWNIKQNISGKTITGYFGRDVALNGSGDILAIGTAGWPFILRPPLFDVVGSLDIIEIYTGNLVNNWILKQSITGSSQYGNQKIALNKSGDILFTSQFDGINIFTGNLTSNWRLKQKVFDPFIPEFFISDNGDYILSTDPQRGIFPNDYGQFSIFNGNINNGWSKIQPTLSGVPSEFLGEGASINGDGNLISLGSRLPTQSIKTYSLQPVFVNQRNTIFTNTGILSELGNSVAISKDGNVVVAGAPSINGPAFPEAKIYVKNSLNNTWNFKQQITGNSSLNKFARIVSINKNGSVIAISSEFPDSVYIYTGNSINGWAKHIQELPFFSNGIAINDEGSIIIGTSASNSGYIYTGNANQGWNLKQNFTGGSIGLNNNANVFASRNSSNNDINIYTGNSIDNWKIKTTITGNENIDFFGHDISINDNGNIIVVGGGIDDPFNNLASALVRIYTGTVNNGWAFKQEFTGIQFAEAFGKGVDINGEGDKIIIGIPRGGAEAATARVHIYDGNANDGWELSNIITGIRSTFGHSVSMDRIGNTIVIGDPWYQNFNGSQDGAVYIIQFADNSLSFQSGDYILFKEITNNLNTISSLTQGFINVTGSFNNNCSQVYYNGIRQKINNNYVENSKFDFISGSFYKNENNYIIYNNNEDFFV